LWCFALFLLAQAMFGIGIGYLLRDALSAAGTHERTAGLEQFKHWVLLFAPALSLVGALACYALSGRSLAPVERVANAAREITGQTLHQRLRSPNSGDEPGVRP